MIIRCSFPCLHISDWQMKIHDHREIDLSLRTYMIELWISAVECWISIVNNGYPLSFAFGFPCNPIYWLYQDCYLFITWSKWFACVKNAKLQFIYLHGMEQWYSTLLCINKSSSKILWMFSTAHCIICCNIFGQIWIWLPLMDIPILKWFWKQK